MDHLPRSCGEDDDAVFAGVRDDDIARPAHRHAPRVLQLPRAAARPPNDPRGRRRVARLHGPDESCLVCLLSSKVAGFPGDLTCGRDEWI